MNAILARVLIALVHVYRASLGAQLGGSCRFTPSCSSYALEALERHGAARGAWLSLRRVLRCHPFQRAGYDPVPQGNEQ